MFLSGPGHHKEHWHEPLKTSDLFSEAFIFPALYFRLFSDKEESVDICMYYIYMHVIWMFKCH